MIENIKMVQVGGPYGDECYIRKDIADQFTKDVIARIRAEVERRLVEWQELINKNNAESVDVVKNLICEDTNILNFLSAIEKEYE